MLTLLTQILHQQGNDTQRASSGDVLLVKASRAVAAEKVIEYIREGSSPAFDFGGVIFMTSTLSYIIIATGLATFILTFIFSKIIPVLKSHKMGQKILI